MKLLKYFFVFILLFSLNFCSTEPEQDYVSFKIKVDKLILPDTISVNDTLVIKFYGTVGPDGCHKFKRFEVTEKQGEIHFTAWGTRPNFDTACPAVMVYLEGKEYKTKLTEPGSYKIFVHQPDNSVLIDSITVVE